jgi:aspartyl-tRNA(Asn)/glutamyl-tRNA(Gln) amidotransferase subunit A
VLLGKLNMAEFGMGPGCNDGAAAAVALHGAAFALGSDTGGAIRASAARRGVIGIRPTYGAVSRYGLAAYASSLDQIGVYARDVRDAAMALGAIMGHDCRDAMSIAREAPDLLAELDEGARGMVVALPKEYLYGGLDSDTRESVLSAAERFEGMGAVVREVSLPSPEEALSAFYVISSAEASSNLARYDGVKYGFRAGCDEGVDEAIEATRGLGFGEEVKRRVMLGAFALCAENFYDYYERALAVRQRVRADFERAFEGCDVMLAPVAPRDTLETYLGDIYTAPANMAGLPALSMPCGVDCGGLPMGVQIIGPPHGEAAILRAARAYTWR